MESKVAVIGPGALGCMFAARLARCGVSTWLIDHQPSRAARLNKTGITIETAHERYTQSPVVTTTIPDDLDFILVLTKAHATSSLRLPTHTPVLTLQNGLGNAETLARLVGNGRVLAGTTAEAVTWISEGHVRHVAEGGVVFGPWTNADAETPMKTLQAAGFTVTVTDAPGKAIWEKAIINAAINPVTAVLNVPNGALLKKRETRELMRDLSIEATRVAVAEGYRFEYSLVEKTEQICEITRENISSMLQDVRKGKRTEIDAISGEILRRAQKTLTPTPRTRVVYQLVRALEPK